MKGGESMQEKQKEYYGAVCYVLRLRSRERRRNEVREEAARSHDRNLMT